MYVCVCVCVCCKLSGEPPKMHVVGVGRGVGDYVQQSLSIFADSLEHSRLVFAFDPVKQNSTEKCVWNQYED